MWWGVYSREIQHIPPRSALGCTYLLFNPSDLRRPVLFITSTTITNTLTSLQLITACVTLSIIACIMVERIMATILLRSYEQQRNSKTVLVSIIISTTVGVVSVYAVFERKYDIIYALK